MDIISATAPKRLTTEITFSKHILIFDAYSKIPELYGMDRITTEEVMDKFDIFQYIFRNIDKFGWWDLEGISADAGTQFTSIGFKDECQTRSVHLTFSDPENQEMDGQVEVTWRTLSTIAHSLMVHVRFSEACIHFELVYTEDHISPVLPIKYLINKDGKPTTPLKLVIGMKPSVSYLRVLLFPCVVRKDTTPVGTEALNICHQVQRGFCSIFVGIPQHQKGYPVYVPHR